MRAVEKCTTQSLHLRALMNALREGGRDVQSGGIRSGSQGLPVEGMSIHEAARLFGLHRDTVRKMLRYSVAPG